MHPDKAPGPDGMNAGFYKRYWGIVGQDVTRVTLDMLNGKDQLREINYINLVLMPKKKSPIDASDYV